MSEWRKSSYSNSVGGNCVETAVPWRKSSYSGATNECVEVRPGTPEVKVRDTQHRDLGHLAFPACEWSSFLKDLKERRL
ncbi:DUF397 domain-containing protein [Streptomonospora algeriensis]|uniref:DUF397 domain-containing protein n=1 Tax=Streptomonospora algeriensis TaxID=995084 RepID=A0ABW3BDC3_9ACTN